MPSIVESQTKPLTIAQIYTALNSRKDENGKSWTIAERNKRAVRDVKKVGVNFSLTAENERGLIEAGATNELLEVIRLPKPKQSPVVKSTSTPLASETIINVGDKVKVKTGFFANSASGTKVIGRVTEVNTKSKKLKIEVLEVFPSSDRFKGIVKGYYSKKEVDISDVEKISEENSSTATTFKNSIGMEFVRISSGTFMMGSPTSEKDRDSDEIQHQVTISKDFYLGKYEVTQGQWKALMGNNPSKFSSCDDCPVEQVSWEDVQECIKKLNAKDSGTYRLPTEAEWEYAARAGTTTAFAFGDNLSSSQANFDGNYPYGNAEKRKYLEKTVEVRSYQPNAWGLYDMHGNVGEWCANWAGEEYYASSSSVDPTRPNSGSVRVFRGGSWYSYGSSLRSAQRNRNLPSRRNYYIGFRLLRMQ